MSWLAKIFNVSISLGYQPDEFHICTNNNKFPKKIKKKKKKIHFNVIFYKHSKSNSKFNFGENESSLKYETHINFEFDNKNHKKKFKKKNQILEFKKEVKANEKAHFTNKNGLMIQYDKNEILNELDIEKDDLCSINKIFIRSISTNSPSKIKIKVNLKYKEEEILKKRSIEIPIDPNTREHLKMNLIYESSIKSDLIGILLGKEDYIRYLPSVEKMKQLKTKFHTDKILALKKNESQQNKNIKKNEDTSEFSMKKKNENEKDNENDENISLTKKKYLEKLGDDNSQSTDELIVTKYYPAKFCFNKNSFWPAMLNHLERELNNEYNKMIDTIDFSMYKIDNNDDLCTMNDETIDILRANVKNKFNMIHYYTYNHSKRKSLNMKENHKIQFSKKNSQDGCLIKKDFKEDKNIIHLDSVKDHSKLIENKFYYCSIVFDVYYFSTPKMDNKINLYKILSENKWIYEKM